jgi:LPXTG-motif cell wall-anchored protein
LRALKLTALLMVVSLVFTAPAIAQGSGPEAEVAGSQQYNGQPTPSLADGVRDVSDTAGRGADAINDALGDDGSSDDVTVPPGGKVAGLTVLPETGGASPFVAGAGALLLSAGLLVRRVIG